MDTKTKTQTKQLSQISIIDDGNLRGFTVPKNLVPRKELHTMIKDLKLKFDKEEERQYDEIWKSKEIQQKLAKLSKLIIKKCPK